MARIAPVQKLTNLMSKQHFISHNDKELHIRSGRRNGCMLTPSWLLADPAMSTLTRANIMHEYSIFSQKLKERDRHKVKGDQYVKKPFNRCKIFRGDPDCAH